MIPDLSIRITQRILSPRFLKSTCIASDFVNLRCDPRNCVYNEFQGDALLIGGTTWEPWFGAGAPETGHLASRAGFTNSLVTWSLDRLWNLSPTSVFPSMQWEQQQYIEADMRVWWVQIHLSIHRSSRSLLLVPVMPLYPGLQVFNQMPFCTLHLGIIIMASSLQNAYLVVELCFLSK